MHGPPTRRGVLAATPGFLLLSACGRLRYDSALPVPPELERLVAALEEARTRKQAVEAAGELLAEGTDLDTLDRALSIACCRQLDFTVIGFAAHPTWTIWSAREIARRSPKPADRVLATLHAVDLFKWEHRESRGDREQPGELPKSLPDPSPADLEQAIADRDPDAANVAAAALFRAGDFEGLQLALGRGALRNVGAIGHPAIAVAQSARTMNELEWEEAVPRTVAWALAHDAGGEDAVLGPWAANLQRADALPPSWDRGVDAVEGTWELVRELRTRSADDAAAAVVARLEGGLGLRSIWDALHVRAAELSLEHVDRDGIFAAFHAVTGLEATRWIAENTLDDHTRRMALLQGAAMLAANDAEALDRSGGAGRVHLDELEAAATTDAGRILALAAEDRIGAAAHLLGLDDRAGFVEAARALALRTTEEEHEFKLPVAAWVAADQAAPEVANAVLAGSLAFGPTAETRDWRHLDLAREIAAEVD